MKKHISQCTKTTVFVLILIMIVSGINHALKFKYDDGITQVEDLYSLPSDSVDVLLVGSSQMGINISVPVLWREKGIAAYCLWGSIQPFWNSYYFIKEALKTQSPKLVVLEVFASTQEDEYSDYSRQIKNTLGLKFSKNKMDAVAASTEKSMWLDFLLEFPTYHSRYKELTKDDFTDSGIDYHMHTHAYAEANAVQSIDVSVITESSNLYAKQELFLRKIIELLQEEQIPILLIKTPIAMQEEWQKRINRVGDIALEYGIPFIDFNNLTGKEFNFDFSCDMYDTAHAQYEGAKKVTRYLAEYIDANYTVPDHRNDKDFIKWDLFSEYTDKNYLNSITQAPVYLKAIGDPGYITIMVSNGKGAAAFDSNLNKILEQYGCQYSSLINDSMNYYCIINGGKVEQEEYGENGLNSTYEFGTKTFDISCGKDLGDVSVVIDQVEYAIKDMGLSIVVYDKNNDEIINRTFISTYTDYSISH